MNEFQLAKWNMESLFDESMEQTRVAVTNVVKMMAKRDRPLEMFSKYFLFEQSLLDTVDEMETVKDLFEIVSEMMCILDEDILDNDVHLQKLYYALNALCAEAMKASVLLLDLQVAFKNANIPEETIEQTGE